MAILKQNLNKRTNNFDDYDKDMAFAIWYIEKEFHIGCLIDDSFPAMKFFNMYDDYNMNKYRELNEKGTTSDNGIPKTFR